MVGEPDFCCRRHLSAVANGHGRPIIGSIHGVGLAICRSSRLGANAKWLPAQRTYRPISAARAAQKPRGIFPRILDEYIVREFVTMFFLVLAGFVMLMIVFTFFDLMGDILRNRIASSSSAIICLNLTPSMLYQIAPLAVLIAALVEFGVLNRNSEIVAIKATGISLYRLVVPIVTIAACLAVSLFLFDQYYLPQANRRQEALRNVIKGRPPQTYLHPEQKWIFGQARTPASRRASSTTSSSIPTAKEFANLSVFEFDPGHLLSLLARIFAKRAVWDSDPSSGVSKTAGCATFRARMSRNTATS